MSKTLKIVLFIGVCLGVVYFVGGSLAPTTYVVERTIHIKASPERITTFVGDFSSWEKWSPWKEQEPEAQSTVTGTPGTPGHKMAWSGKKLGEGSMTLVRVTPGAEVVSELIFISPKMMASVDSFLVTPASDGSTRVIWHNQGNLASRAERWFGLLFMNRMIGADYENGLAKLKTVLEHESNP